MIKKPDKKNFNMLSRDMKRYFLKIQVERLETKATVSEIEKSHRMELMASQTQHKILPKVNILQYIIPSENRGGKKRTGKKKHQRAVGNFQVVQCVRLESLRRIRDGRSKKNILEEIMTRKFSTFYGNCKPIDLRILKPKHKEREENYIAPHCLKLIISRNSGSDRKSTLHAEERML